MRQETKDLLKWLGGAISESARYRYSYDFDQAIVRRLEEYEHALLAKDNALCNELKVDLALVRGASERALAEQLQLVTAQRHKVVCLLGVIDHAIAYLGDGRHDENSLRELVEALKVDRARCDA